MSTGTAVPSPRALGQHPAPFDPARWFYPLAGVALLAATIAGFQQFYFHWRAYPGREITPPIRTLIIAHGVAMSSWILLFTVQPLLIATRRRRLHMALGRFGAVLAAAVLVLGSMVAVQSARVSPPGMKLWGMPPKQFMAVPLVSVFVFAAFVAVALWNRRRPALHRAMMFTATLCVVDAAIARIDPVSNLYLGTAWERLFGPFLGMLALGAALLALRCALTRSLDRWPAIGLAILVVTSMLTVAVSRTGAWDSFASMLVP